MVVHQYIYTSLFTGHQRVCSGGGGSEEDSSPGSGRKSQGGQCPPVSQWAHLCADVQRCNRLSPYG